jgi:DNA-binding transcriptional MerR regulator
MVRKHFSWTRQRSKRSRPKTPAPKTGWVISELSRLSELSVRTIRYYVERGLIRPLEIRGTATRYQRVELLRLLAIPILRAGKRRSVDELKREFERLGESELEKIVITGKTSPEAATALGLSVQNVVSTSAVEDARNVRGELRLAQSNAALGTAIELGASETWHYVRLLPGLDLRVSANASPAVRNAAKRILDEYVG